MNKIGIMQGRVFPEHLDTLQMFPISAWLREISEIKALGFDYIELLFDKALCLENLFNNPSNFDALGICNKEGGRMLNAYSICADYFSSISMLDKKCEDIFYSKIIRILNVTKNTNLSILVIPFYEKNMIESESDFERVLDWFDSRKLDRKANSYGIKLALEIDLPAIILYEGFAKRSFKNIGICYDLGNAKAAGYEPEREILQLKDFIVHIHIKDRKIGGPNVMLGEGDVRLKLCLKSLRDICYNGLMTLETKYSEAPAAEAFGNLKYFKNLLKLISS